MRRTNMKKMIRGCITMLLCAAMVIAGTFSPVMTYAASESDSDTDLTVSGSKTASPTELEGDNRKTTVTLSLPSGEYKNSYDIVFVMDSSSSTKNSSIDFSTTVLGLLDSVKDKNIDLNVGVIKVRGRAFDTVSLVTDGAQEKLVEYSDSTKQAIKDAINYAEADLKKLSSGTNMHGGLKLADKWLSTDTKVSDDHKYVFFLTDGKTYIWNDDADKPTSIYGQYMAKNKVYPTPAIGQSTVAYSKSAYRFTDNSGYYNKEAAGDLANLTFDEYFEKTHNFYTNDYAKLYASSNKELSTTTKYDYYCRYADLGSASADGTVTEHALSNGNYTYALHKKYYEFTPADNFDDLNWLQANPYTVEVSENGDYSYTTTPNPDFYQLHPDGLQKALYLTGHLWTDMVGKYNGAAIVYSGWGSGSGLEIAQSFDSWIKSTGISDYAADISDADSVKDIFNTIKEEILYMVSKGVVTDVITDDFSLDNTGSSDCFRVTLGGESLTVVLSDGKWNVGAADENGVYPYVVEYDKTTKTITWTINVPVENANPITLSYDLILSESAASGTYDTNVSAVLDYTSTDGTYDGRYVFEKPKVTYKKLYTLTVNYVYENGKTAAASYTNTLAANTAYGPITSPTIKGYKADKTSVSGTMPEGNLVITVVYKKTTTTTTTDDDNPGGGGGTVTPADDGTVIPDTPAPTTEPETEPTIPDPAVPLADNDGAWALVNLICSILTVLGALVAIFRRKKDDDEDEDEEDQYNMYRAEDEDEDEDDNRGKKMFAAKAAGVLTAIASVITFILTEDMRLPMILIDKWTLLMVIMLAVQIVAAVLNKKASKKDDDDEEEEGAEQPAN